MLNITIPVQADYGELLITQRLVCGRDSQRRPRVTDLVREVRKRCHELGLTAPGTTLL